MRKPLSVRSLNNQFKKWAGQWLGLQKSVAQDVEILNAEYRQMLDELNKHAAAHLQDQIPDPDLVGGLTIIPVNSRYVDLLAYDRDGELLAHKRVEPRKLFKSK